MTQHHDRGEEESGRVGKTLAGDIRGRTMNSLEDRALIADIAGGSETETTDQTSAHIGQDVTVQVGHDEDLVVVRVRVGGHLQAGVVEELGVELNVGELLGDCAGSVEEETVRHLHDGSLVDSADLVAADGAGVLESEAKNALRGVTGDELDGLNDTINNDVLNTGVFTLSVLTDENSVDIVVWGLVASDGDARTQVGEKVECTAESQVERDVALADRSLEDCVSPFAYSACSSDGAQTYGERALQRDVVALDALNGIVRNGSLAVLEDGGDIDGFPVNRSL